MGHGRRKRGLIFAPNDVLSQARDERWAFYTMAMKRPWMLNTRGVREYNTIKYTFRVLKYVYYLYFTQNTCIL